MDYYSGLGQNFLSIAPSRLLIQTTTSGWPDDSDSRVSGSALDDKDSVFWDPFLRQKLETLVETNVLAREARRFFGVLVPP